MQTKTITTNELMFIATGFLQVWESVKSQIQLKGKSLFYLIALKKEIEQHFTICQETVANLAEQHGGVFNQEIGGYEIPEDRRVEANTAINEFGRTELEINYTPIVIGEDSHIPVDLLDAIFDFVSMD